jgi:hypothetical protein
VTLAVIQKNRNLNKMNLFALAILLLLVPLIFQLTFGRLSFKKRLNFPFEYISLLCFFAQLLFIFLALKIVDIDAKNQGVNCGMPQASMFFAGMFFTIVLLITIVVQLFARKVAESKSNSKI